MPAYRTFRTLAVVASAALLVAALVACASPETDAGPAEGEAQIDLQAEEQAVRAVNETWLERARAKDAEGIGALFVENGWTLSAEDGLVDGRAAIVAANQENFDENPDAVPDWGGKQVWVAASGDLAVERGWWKDAENGRDGEYITVMLKVDGEWKVLADVSDPVVGTAESE